MNSSGIKWKECTSRPSWLNYFEIELLTVALPVSFYIITNPPVVCWQTMQHHHKLHSGPLQKLCLSFLIWSINQRLSALSPLCSWGGAGLRGHGGACGVLGESWPTRLGLWRKAWVDLQQQPGRRADSARPTGGLKAAHTQTHSPAVCGFRTTGQDTVVEISQRKGENQRCDSQRHCMLRWQGHETVDGLSWDERRGKRERLQETESKARWRETQREKGASLRDRNCIPLEGRLS